MEIPGEIHKDRITILAESPKAPIQRDPKKVKAIHERDLAAGWGRVQPELAARLMGYGTMAEVSMPIRIRRHDESLYGMQAAGTKGLLAAPWGEPTACYTGRKSKSRILCGPIYLLLGPWRRTMTDNEHHPFENLPPEIVYTHLTEYYLYQDELSWSRTQLLVAVEGGALAAAFALRPLAVPTLLVGTVLTSLIWRLVERDWEVRDQNLGMLDKAHGPLGIRMTKRARSMWWRGAVILRTVFASLLAVNLILAFLFVLAHFCKCRALDVFRSTSG
jgi:hypothetical protein